MEVPNGSVVMGSPGKVKSTLDDKGKEALELNAIHYVNNYNRFKKELIKSEV